MASRHRLLTPRPVGMRSVSAAVPPGGRRVRSCVLFHLSVVMVFCADSVVLSPLSLLPAPTQMLDPVTLPGIVSCVLSVLCGGLNLLRGVHAIESILQVRVPGSPPPSKKL